MPTSATETTAPKLLYTLHEAATALGMPANQLRQLTKDLLVPHRRVTATDATFTRADLDEIAKADPVERDTDDTPPKVLYTLDEAVAILHTSRSGLYRQVRDREVPFRKVGRRGVTFTQADLDQIIAAAHRPPVPPVASRS